MQYHSTRGLKDNISAAEAIIRGLAPDGGLYVPDSFPHISTDEIEALCRLGFERRNAEELFVPNGFGQIGFADFTIRNNGANIRRLKKRLESVARLKSTPTNEYPIGEVRSVENTEANRLQVCFPEKPSETVRKELKSNGFRWASIAACWQSYLNERQKYRIERILKNETGKS